ncbi:MAG: DegT/DnrJ/EryC1/StrS family aminotransferase, partial [Bryobacteraceae bacterium]|nr:DegT/DnrJ/EryC1/StrS family aminotransferase [Bryobacteraceae bacterium]
MRFILKEMRIPKWPVAGERERELLREVLESSQWGGFHPFVERFEQAFASFQHCPFGVSCANGTVAIEVTLQAAGIGPGDEVIVPAISFISTATAVSRLGATPVFVDIEPFSFHLDPERARAAISPRTRAILVVHFGGPMAHMDRLVALARDYGLALLEDAAHAHGSEWNGKRAGSFGLAGTFSFQNSKVMTAGEGGIVVTGDAALADRIRSLANQGRRPGSGWFHHYALGTNYRMTALQAAVLLAQLERLPEQIQLRHSNAERLKALLADVEGITWQQVAQQAARHSYYLLLGRVDARRFGMNRDELCEALTASGIPCTPFYPHPLYGNPVYQGGGCRVQPCPVAEECVRDAFWLPH